MSRHKRKRAHGKKVRRPVIPVSPQTSAPRDNGFERLFASLRQGAANVSGVTFQIAVTLWVLLEGRVGTTQGLDVQAVVPEGLEDIDCSLRSGGSLLIQAKEHGVGARAIGASEVGKIIAHAAAAISDGRRFAIVTNGRFGSSLPITGFSGTLQEAISALPDPDAVRAPLLLSLAESLREKGLPPDAAPTLLSQTHLVSTGEEASARTLAVLT